MVRERFEFGGRLSIHATDTQFLIAFENGDLLTTMAQLSIRNFSLCRDSVHFRNVQIFVYVQIIHTDTDIIEHENARHCIPNATNTNSFHL